MWETEYEKIESWWFVTLPTSQNPPHAHPSTATMSEANNLPHTPSPQQLAKQKQEFINIPIDEEYPNKNYPFLCFPQIPFEDIDALTYISTSYSNNSKRTYKIIKHECVCGKINYAECHFVNNGLSNHILSTFGNLYDIYVKNENERHTIHIGRIFVCILCSHIITSCNGFFVPECYLHMKNHFSQHITETTLTSPVIMHPYTAYNILEIFFVVNTNYAEMYEYAVHGITHDYMEEREKHTIKQCAICEKYFATHHNHDILFHIWDCSSNFINKSNKANIEDGLLDRLTEIFLLFT